MLPQATMGEWTTAYIAGSHTIRPYTHLRLSSQHAIQNPNALSFCELSRFTNVHFVLIRLFRRVMLPTRDYAVP